MDEAPYSTSPAVPSLNQPMDFHTATQETPLLGNFNADEPEVEAKLQQTNNARDVQFYEPNVILDVPKEMVLGYLVLLTGGNYKYTSPSEGNGSNRLGADGTEDPKEQNFPHSKNKLPEIDESTAALAYAAITDGNVLHTCFGLKPGPNGRPSNITCEKQSSSIFCCFPSASATTSFQNLRSSKNKKEMQRLIEVLRDVNDSKCDAKGKRMNLIVIEAYIQCFSTVVMHHDELSRLQGNDVESTKKSMLCSFPNILLSLRNLFSPKITELDVKIEKLNKNSMDEIEKAFRVLNECLSEMGTDVSSVAGTGVTVDCKEDL